MKRLNFQGEYSILAKLCSQSQLPKRDPPEILYQQEIMIDKQWNCTVIYFAPISPPLMISYDKALCLGLLTIVKPNCTSACW